MKLFNLSKGFLAILFLCNLFSVNVNAQVNSQVQPFQGITGYESQSATINFMDLPQSNPNQVVSNQSAHVNPRRIEHEGDERGFNRNQNIDPNRTKLQNNNVPVHQIDHVQTVSPTPILNFAGTGDNNAAIPPDTHGAVGPNHIMETLNTQVRITDKTGTQISIVDLSAFWQSLGEGNTTFDPKIVYDPYSNRYIFTTFAGPQNASVLMIAASQTNDPTGSWNLFKVVVDPTHATWLDYPNLGFNKNWIVICGNVFSGANFTGAEVYAFNKANIYNNVNAQYTKFGPSATDFSICPTFTYDANINDMYLVEAVDGTAGFVRLFTMSGTATLPTLVQNVNINGNILWSDYPNNTGADTGPQLGSTHKIDLNDDRISNATFRNNSIWFAHNAYLPVSAPTRCSILWWQVDTLGNVQQNGLIDDPANVDNYAFPSVAVNQVNDVLIGYTHFSAQIHPAAAYQYRAAADPTSTLESIYTYKAGLAAYYKTNSGPNNRWGDYSATAIDPSDNQTLWTLQEYVASSNNWGTWWAKIYQCNAPLAPDSIISPITHCAGTNATYKVNPVLGATSYTWSFTGAGWGGSSNSDTISVMAGAGAGTITVVANNSCGSSTSFTINVSPTPPITTAPTITQPTIQCIGSGSTYTASTVQYATSYIWTVSGAGWSGTSTTNTITITGGAGVGTIIVKASNACGTGPGDTIYVTPAQPLPATDSIHYTLPVCQGSPITFTADTVSGATSYTWTVTGTGWTGTSTTNSITLTAGSGALTLSVAATTVCGAGATKTISNINSIHTYSTSFTISNISPVQNQAVTVTYIGNAPSTATYNWIWALGTATGSGQGPYSVYWTLPGVKNISLSIIDSGCTSSTTTHALTVGLSGINEITTNQLNIQVYPNPNDGNFNIVFNEIKSEKLTLRLVDILGQDVYNEEFTPTLSTFTKTINVGHLATGIYWLDILGNESGSSSKIKVLIK